MQNPYNKYILYGLGGVLIYFILVGDSDKEDEDFISATDFQRNFLETGNV